jgi:ATP-dependent RNA helicase DHX29
MLMEKYLHAKGELLKVSLSSGAEEMQPQSATKQINRLQRRIQKIERDVLFDRDEANATWEQMRNEIDLEYTRVNASAIRRTRRTQEHDDPDEFFAASVEDSTSGLRDNRGEEGLFGSMFEQGEHEQTDGEAAPPTSITIRDFGRLGAGTNPRRVLDDICKTR